MYILIERSKMNFDTYIEKVANFVDAHREMINCHLVDFITDGIWERCLPAQLRSQFEICKNDNVRLLENKEVNSFIEQAKSLSLDASLDVINKNNAQNDLLNSLIHEIKFQYTYMDPKSDFMKVKKCHEVEILGRIVANMAEKTSSLVIDAGAGKAYLSTYLSEVHGIPVIAIDSSKTCQKGAVIRQKKMQKGKKQHQPTIRYLVEEINDATDYRHIVNLHFPSWIVRENLILTGLHTCGSLADSLINVFLREKHIRSILIVPCCYHLTNESRSKVFNLSKNARMLAQQSVERTTKDGCPQPVLFYRALLQVLLHSMGLHNVRVGRGGSKDDFSTYARWALIKIGVDIEKVPTAESLDKLYQNYRHLKRKFELFQMLRIHLSNVIEAAIMLERIIYLKDAVRGSNVGVLRLFDPLLSPRCYALFATK